MIAYLVSLLFICASDIDLIEYVNTRTETSCSALTVIKELIVKLITAGVIAGGCKASLHLFRDVMKIRANAENERYEIIKSAQKKSNNLAQQAAMGDLNANDKLQNLLKEYKIDKTI